jgi:hypothetical protein
MASQPDPHVGLTGARFGRVHRDAPEPENTPESDGRPAPIGARFGRASRAAPEPEPEEEPLEWDDRAAPTGARFGGASGGRRRKRAARAAARAETPPSPEPPAPAAAERQRPAPEPEPEPEPDWEPNHDPMSAPTIRVRPYVHTGGRTRAQTPLPIEALVYAVPGRSSLRLHGTHLSVLELCQRPQSVAEVSALLGLPLGVARVLVDDLIAERVVTVQRGVDESAPDLALMQRVLAGLHQL